MLEDTLNKSLTLLNSTLISSGDTLSKVATSLCYAERLTNALDLTLSLLVYFLVWKSKIKFLEAFNDTKDTGINILIKFCIIALGIGLLINILSFPEMITNIIYPEVGVVKFLLKK